MNPPITYFAEISRIDEESRIVEGFCYANARVRSDPFDLPFEVLRASADDYMRWANVREMHDNKAVGTAMTIEFRDDQKVFIRAEIVDDAAWAKVKKKVYKGFSLKGRPEVARGSTKAHKFTWLETSLVDRPADPDAIITLWRRDDGGDPTEDFIQEPGQAGKDQAILERDALEVADGLTSDEVPVRENLDPRLVGCLHYDCGAGGCHGHRQHAAARRCSMARAERGDVHVPDELTDEEAAELSRAALTEGSAIINAVEAALIEELDDMDLTELTARMDTLVAENAALVARLDALGPQAETVARLETSLTETQATIERLDSERATLAAEVQRLGDQPAGEPIVRFPGALPREVVQRNNAANLGPDLTAKLARYDELRAAKPEADSQAQNKQVEEMLDLTRELRANGVVI